MSRVLGTILLTLCLGGCSWVSEFVVVNDLDSSAELVVRLFPAGAGAGNCATGRLAQAPAAQLKPSFFRRATPEWSALAATSYKLDSAKCVLTVSLAPHTAVRVARMMNQPAPQDADPSLLAVQELVVTRPEGHARYDAVRLAASFTRVGAGLYAVFLEPAA